MRVINAADYVMAADTLFQQTQNIIEEQGVKNTAVEILLTPLIAGLMHQLGRDLFGEEEYGMACAMLQASMDAALKEN